MNCCCDNQDTCVSTLKINNKVFNKIPFGIDRYFKPELRSSYEEMSKKRCPDCGVKFNMFHHKNCDWQTCPRCLGQRLQCEMDRCEY